MIASAAACPQEPGGGGLSRGETAMASPHDLHALIDRTFEDLAVRLGGVAATEPISETTITRLVHRGRDGPCGPPLPPNRTGGFPAYGSPVVVLSSTGLK